MQVYDLKLNCLSLHFGFLQRQITLQMLRFACLSNSYIISNFLIHSVAITIRRPTCYYSAIHTAPNNKQTPRPCKVSISELIRAMYTKVYMNTILFVYKITSAQFLFGSTIWAQPPPPQYRRSRLWFWSELDGTSLNMIWRCLCHQLNLMPSNVSVANTFFLLHYSTWSDYV